MKQQRVLVIADISLMGRCSAMVAQSVLSCLGHEVVVLPTCLLSAHTAFAAPFRKPLNQEMRAILAHFDSLSFVPDAVYVGYLGSEEQMDTVAALVERMKAQGAKIVIDPVMGDHGRRYAFVTDAYRDGFLRMLPYADMVLPNETEWRLLMPEASDRPLAAFRALTQAMVVVTGVDAGERIAVRYLLPGRTEEGTMFRPRHPISAPGTGDLFASALLGLWLNGQAPEQAIGRSMDFVLKSLEPLESAAQAIYGAPYERALGLLMNGMK